MVFQHCCSSSFSLSLRNSTCCSYTETYLGSFFPKIHLWIHYIDELHNLEKYCIVAEVLLKMSHFSKWFILLHAQRKPVSKIIYVTLLSGCSSLGCELAKYQENLIFVCSNKEVFGFFGFWYLVFFPLHLPKDDSSRKANIHVFLGGIFFRVVTVKCVLSFSVESCWFEPLFYVKIVGALLCLNSTLAV